MMTRLLASFFIGALVTAALFAASCAAAPYPFPSELLFWQEGLLTVLPAWHWLVSPQSPLFATLTLMAGFPLGVFVYGAAAFVWLHRRAPNNSFKPKPLRGSA